MKSNRSTLHEITDYHTQCTNYLNGVEVQDGPDTGTAYRLSASHELDQGHPKIPLSQIDFDSGATAFAQHRLCLCGVWWELMTGIPANHLLNWCSLDTWSGVR